MRRSDESVCRNASRDAIEAALRSGMDPAELKRLIDEAAAAVLPSSGGHEAMRPPSSAAAATASPWQQGPGVRRRGRPSISRKSPFEGANPRCFRPCHRAQLPTQLYVHCLIFWSSAEVHVRAMLTAAASDCRPRRQAEEASPAVEPMTREEIEAAARKLGKQPEAWLQDARDRGILAVPDRS
jgi:hypothetical protein